MGFISQHNLYIGSNGPIVVTSFKSAFNGMVYLETIDLGDNLDTSLMTDTSRMFGDTISLTKINGIEDLDVSSVTNMMHMFNMEDNTYHRQKSNLTTLNISNWDTSNVTDMSNMFRYVSNLTKINGIENLKTNNVKNMSYMFSAIRNLDLSSISGWDVSSVTNMSGMFSSTRSLTTLDLSKWETSSVTDMSDMFSGTSLTILDLSNWNTSSVTNMSRMFETTNLKTINLNGWDTSSVTDMSSMFEYGTGFYAGVTNQLENIYMNNVTFDQVISYDHMFYNHNSFLKITTNDEAKSWLLSNASELGKPLLTDDNFMPIESN